MALTRAIQHTYVVSPLDMSGMIGIAQTLAVYHYGYFTLKAGQIYSHESAIVPSDAAAVLEWNLDVPFTSLDKPPLAIAMIVTINGERSLRRYRLVIAHKSKLRLAPEVLATFASHSRDHRLTASGFFPCSIDREYLYGYAADGFRSPLCCVLPIMNTQSYYIDNEAPRFSSTKPCRTESSLRYRASTISMLIDYELTCCRLRSSNCILVRVTSQILKEPEIQSKILHRMKNETPRTLRQILKLRRKRLGVLRCQMRQMTLLKVRSLVPPTS